MLQLLLRHASEQGGEPWGTFSLQLHTLEDEQIPSALVPNGEDFHDSHKINLLREKKNQVIQKILNGCDVKKIKWINHSLIKKALNRSVSICSSASGHTETRERKKQI